MGYVILAMLALGIGVSGYLIGSVSWAVIISSMVYHVDIYKVGSGNAGGTNVGRAVGKKGAILVIVLDSLKCLLPLWIWFFVCTLTSFKDYTASISASFPLAAFYYAAGFGAGLGHVFPLYYHFKGGKAVSCFAGFIIGTNWLLMVIGCAIFFSSFFWKKRVSFSSIVGTVLTSLCSIVIVILNIFYPDLFAFSFWFFPGPKFDGGWIYALYVCFFALMVLILHRANMVRLAKKTEPETHFLHRGEKPVTNYDKDDKKA